MIRTNTKSPGYKSDDNGSERDLEGIFIWGSMSGAVHMASWVLKVSIFRQAAANCRLTGL